MTRGATTGFRDTYKFGVGMNYRCNEKLLLQTGFTFDTSALKNRDRIASLPIDQQFRIAQSGLGPVRPRMLAGPKARDINTVVELTDSR